MVMSVGAKELVPDKMRPGQVTKPPDTPALKTLQRAASTVAILEIGSEEKRAVRRRVDEA